MTYEYLESRLGWGYNFFNKECLPWGCTKNTDYTGFEKEAADTDLGENIKKSLVQIFILAMVTLTFYLIRKEKQLLVTVLVPTLIIAFLSALSAVIPNNSGEKYG